MHDLKIDINLDILNSKIIIFFNIIYFKKLKRFKKIDLIDIIIFFFEMCQIKIDHPKFSKLYNNLYIQDKYR